MRPRRGKNTISACRYYEPKCLPVYLPGPMAGWARRAGVVLVLCLVFVFNVMPGARTVCLAGMDVMTNAELSDVQGGDVRIDISNPGYYGDGDNTTVVRFAADIYTEVYAQIGAIRLGHYDRDDLTNMGVLHSEDIIRFDNPRTGGVGSSDTPGPTTSWGSYGPLYNRSLDTMPYGFGTTDGPEWSQWDVNLENITLGSASHPFRLYGLIFRAEFSNWGEQNQQLDRIILGSNQVYGHAGLRGLVTSGYISFNLAHLTQGMGTLIKTPRFFQLTRDPMVDYHWQMSSLSADPETGDQDVPGTRELWFNTNISHDSINKLSTNYGPYTRAAFDTSIEDHGAFLALDFTEGQFRGWNLLAGVNEYEEWPKFGMPHIYTGVVRLEEGGADSGEGDY